MSDLMFVKVWSISIPMMFIFSTIYARHRLKKKGLIFKWLRPETKTDIVFLIIFASIFCPVICSCIVHFYIKLWS